MEGPPDAGQVHGRHCEIAAKKEKNIKIREIKLDEEQVVWISNFGA